MVRKIVKLSVFDCGNNNRFLELDHIMVEKQLTYRYGMRKLRHCHPVYGTVLQ